MDPFISLLLEKEITLVIVWLLYFPFGWQHKEGEKKREQDGQQEPGEEVDR